MGRKPFLRLAAAVIGGLFAATALLSLLIVINADGGFAATTGASLFGWTILIVAGIVVGGVAWLLLTSTDAPDQGRELRPGACERCGSPTIDEWRLCPDCGHALGTQAGPPVSVPGETLVE